MYIINIFLLCFVILIFYTYLTQHPRHAVNLSKIRLKISSFEHLSYSNVLLGHSLVIISGSYCNSLVAVYYRGYLVLSHIILQNANDSNLRQLYIKAFNNRESRLETRTGLMKAVKGRYGFFVSATLARRALRTTFIQERCILKELLLPQTLTVVALPMAKSCPYRKIINLKYAKLSNLLS